MTITTERQAESPVTQPHGFDALYTASSRRLIHQLYAMTGDLSEAQDCVQEAFARAWQRWTEVSTYDDPEAWVRTVARRIAVSRWRRARTALTHLVRHGHPDPVPAPSEDHLVLVAALRRIPRHQREAVVLHHLVGLSVEDVARQTQAPVGTVKARLHRGRAALAAAIGTTQAPPWPPDAAVEDPVDERPADRPTDEEAPRAR